MNSTLVTVFLVAGSFTRSGFPQTICVQIYDSAHVRPATLKYAVVETGRLFRTSGVRIDWREETARPENWRMDMSSPTAGKTDVRPCLVVSILNDSANAVFRGALGFALPFAQTGPHAIIFYNRVETAARVTNTAPYIALGHALAHELGHDLLRSSEHSRAGLMQARWDSRSWQLASEGLLAFLPEERERIRQAAREIASSVKILDQH